MHFLAEFAVIGGMIGLTIEAIICTMMPDVFTVETRIGRHRRA